MLVLCNFYYPIHFFRRLRNLVNIKGFIMSIEISVAVITAGGAIIAVVIAGLIAGFFNIKSKIDDYHQVNIQSHDSYLKQLQLLKEEIFQKEELESFSIILTALYKIQRELMEITNETILALDENIETIEITLATKRNHNKELESKLNKFLAEFSSSDILIEHNNELPRDNINNAINNTLIMIDTIKNRSK